MATKACPPQETQRWSVSRERRHQRLKLWQTFLSSFWRKVDVLVKIQLKFEVALRRSQVAAGVFPRMFSRSLVSVMNATLNKAKTGTMQVRVTNLGQEPVSVAVSSDQCPHSHVQNYGNAKGRFRACSMCRLRWKLAIGKNGAQTWVEHGFKGGKESSTSGLPASSQHQQASSTAATKMSQDMCPARGTLTTEIMGKSGLRRICQNYPHCEGSSKKSHRPPHPKMKAEDMPVESSDEDLMEPEERRQARFNDDIAAATRESVETFMNQRLTELGQQLKTQQGTIVQQQNALQQMSMQRNFQANQVGQIAQNQSALHQSVTCQAGQVGQVVQNQEALHRSVAAQIESVVQSPVRKRATVPLQAIGADQQLEQLILQQLNHNRCSTSRDHRSRQNRCCRQRQVR